MKNWYKGYPRVKSLEEVSETFVQEAIKSLPTHVAIIGAGAGHVDLPRKLEMPNIAESDYYRDKVHIVGIPDTTSHTEFEELPLDEQLVILKYQARRKQ